MPLLATVGHAWDVALDLATGGEPIPTLVNVASVGDETVCILLRFDERRRYERAMAQAEARAQQLAQENQALREINRMRQDFINTAAHELATPLTPLKLQLHILRAGLGAQAAKQAKALDTIETSIGKLTTFINDLRASAQAQSGQLHAAREPRNLATAVEDIADAWHAQRPQQAVTVTSDAQVKASVDSKLLEQALYRILDNARKFGQGKPIDVSVRANPPRIIVQDHGIGIEPQRIAELGKPFTQAHDRSQITSLGAGLGLHIARAMLEAQGASLRLESQGLGTGTTVTMTFAPSRQGA